MRSGDSLEVLIHEELISIGVSPRYRGYSDLLVALKYVVGNELCNRTLPMTGENGLYTHVANELDRSPSKVERSIRYIVDIVFNNPANSSVLREIFGNIINIDSGKVTNSAFIKGLARHISLYK